DIAQAVAKAGLAPHDAFLAAERQHTELLDWLPKEGAPPQSLEGYLFPDTYYFPRHTSPVRMLAAMVRRFRQVSEQLQLTGDIQRTVIMASLVEKEVNQDNERPLVAGVFNNRLRQGMPLATDPTVIYAALLENRWRGTIYASDLQSTSPYNTYKHPGLPPGPICNPGIASLRAAMNPAPTDYLYFVSDAAGHSRFSTDLKQHSQQVQAYRESQKAQHPPAPIH
ncbi:MAG TPA: endolytic transglycosylase MltG, partial [Edaphobacter sp.]|nr:endolytic transglycosylase MltG [Edaphobacter sp.]